MSKRSMPGQGRTDAYLFDPDELSIVDDPKHHLYDERINAPLREEMVLNIMAKGVLKPILFGEDWEGYPAVVDGRQRIRHAREANRRLRAAGEKPIRVVGMRKRGTEVELAGVGVSANEFGLQDEPIVKARKASRMLDMGATNDEVMVAFGWSIKTLKAHLKLLGAAPQVKKAVAAGKLSVTAVAKLPEKHEEQSAVLDKIEKSGGRATVRAAARVARGKTAEPPTAPSKEAVEWLHAHVKREYGEKGTRGAHERSFARGAAWARGLLDDPPEWLNDAMAHGGWK